MIAGTFRVDARAAKRPLAPEWISLEDPKLRSRLLYPNPVCFLTTSALAGDVWKKNVMTISWLTCLNNEGDVLLSLNTKRHSAAAVLSGRPFGLSVPTSDLASLVLKVGGCSGRSVDKFATVEGLDLCGNQPGRGDAAVNNVDSLWAAAAVLAIMCPADDPCRGRSVDATKPTEMAVPE